MRKSAARISSFWTDENGMSSTEYAVVLALIVLASVAAIGLLGFKLRDVFNGVHANVTTP